MKPEIDYQNIIVKYVVSKKDVPYVGELKAVVEISKKPIFSNAKSIDVTFFSSSDDPTENDPTVNRISHSLGTTTISYKSIGLEKYNNRIMLSLILPSECLRSNLPYETSRVSAKKLLPEIIAEHEKKYFR
jgi:hypothetical protein